MSFSKCKFNFFFVCFLEETHIQSENFYSHTKSKIMKIISLIFALFLLGNLFLQAQTPVKDQSKAVFLVGGTLHVGNGVVIENAVVGFDKGKITMVGKASEVQFDKTSADVLDITGKQIYPGFIATNTNLGLNEIDAARPTADYNEVGSVNPNVRAIIAYNTDSRVTPTVRSNGVLMAQIAPVGGLISGSSSVVELEGWNWEDAAYKIDEGIYLNFPAMGIYNGRGAPAPDEQVKNRDKQRDKQFVALNDLFNTAKVYSEIQNVGEKNLKLEAMRGLFDGSKKLFIRVDEGKSIIAAVKFAKSYGITPVIVGGTDAWMVTEVLKENNVPVILTQTHKLPARDFEDVYLPYKTPSLLIKAGIHFCLSTGGAWQQRNLMFEAGTSSAHGLTKEEALSSISLNVAQILGIGKTVGSVEIGKDATLFISTGDALDMKSNNVETAFIRGKKIDLDNKQKALYRKFKGKYDGK